MLRRSNLVPPLRDRIHAGFGNWNKVGQEFLGIFTRLGGLKANDRVLEVGCGFGRMAIALTRYLDARGTYEGIDVSPEGIDWCRTRVSPRYPNFHFRHMDARSDVYNPAGAVDPSALEFPYPDRSFDFVYLTSVLTHVLPPAIETYLRETSRVLASGGRCIVTYFLLDAEAIKLMRSGRSEISFPYDFGTFRVQDRNHPERAVAYDATYVRGAYSKTRLKIIEPIHWGCWSGRERFLSVQDVVVAENA